MGINKDRMGIIISKTTMNIIIIIGIDSNIQKNRGIIKRANSKSKILFTKKNLVRIITNIIVKNKIISKKIANKITNKRVKIIKSILLIKINTLNNK